MDVVFGKNKLAGWLVFGGEEEADSQSKVKQKPGVLICQGFPSSEEQVNLPAQSYQPLAERIAQDLGWSALLFNYRGCGDSPGNFSMLGWLDDVCVAAKYLQSQVSEVWLVGFGMGGALAIGCAAKLKNIAGVVTAGAPADFSDWAENSAQLLDYSRQLGLISDENFPKDEQAWVEELLELQVEKHSGELSGRPLLVIHGSEDTMVPTLDARAIAAAHTGAEIRIMEGVTYRSSVDPRTISIILGWLTRQTPKL